MEFDALFQEYLEERRHGDRRAAMIAYIVAASKGSKMTFDDFMLTPEKQRPQKKQQTVRDMLFVAEMLNAAFGGEDLREKVD